MRDDDNNTRGYNIYADRTIYLPGDSAAYLNLGICITPPVNTRIIVMKGDGPEHEHWKPHSKKLGIDSTGEAMVALRNKRSIGTVIEENAILAQIIIASILGSINEGRSNGSDDPMTQTEEKWCEGCQKGTCTFTKCRGCITTLCYTCWKYAILLHTDDG